MLTKSFWIRFMLVLLSFFLIACEAEDDLPPQPALEARDRFAEIENVPAAEVEILDYEQRDWDDTCLELTTTGLECDDEVTPGWLVTVELNEETYELRTNSDGSVALWEGQSSIPSEVDVTQDVEVDVDVASIEGMSVEQELVPFDAEETDLWEATPQHLHVTINGYPLTQVPFQPQMRVYEVAAMEAVRGDVERILLEHQQIYTALDQAQLDLDRDALVLVSLVQAEQEFYALPQAIEFQNGSGYRFLTRYTDGEEAIAQGDLFYAFQGLTDDDDYIVTAILPVDPPEAEEVTVESLEMVDPADFTPQLSTLDSLIESITLQPVE